MTFLELLKELREEHSHAAEMEIVSLMLEAYPDVNAEDVAYFIEYGEFPLGINV